MLLDKPRTRSFNFRWWILFAWKAWKVVLHILYRKSEVERICAAGNSPAGAVALSKSLSHSKHAELSTIRDRMREVAMKGKEDRSDAYVGQVCQIKSISDAKAKSTLASYMLLYCRVEGVCAWAQRLSKAKYDKNNKEHVQLLRELWLSSFGSDLEFEPVSTRWQHLGFQQKDPTTDFRGMGLLVPIALQYIAEKHNEQYLRVTKAALSGTYEYPFAVVCIDMTQLAVSCLKRRLLDRYLLLHNTDEDAFLEFISRVTSLSSFFLSLSPFICTILPASQRCTWPPITAVSLKNLM